jgi:hypothetical protein
MAGYAIIPATLGGRSSKASKTKQTKQWAVELDQVVECLPSSKQEALVSVLSITKKPS